MKIRPEGSELFHADGQTARHDEGNSRFRNFANAPKHILHRSCKSRFINRPIIPDAFPKMSPFKLLNTEIYCFITAANIQRTMI